MEQWIAEHANPSFEFDTNHKLTRREKKHRLNARLEKLTGRDSSKRHFKLIRSWEG